MASPSSRSNSAAGSGGSGAARDKNAAPPLPEPRRVAVADSHTHLYMQSVTVEEGPANAASVGAPAVVLVGTTTGDIPPTSLLRRIASDVRLSDVRRVALAGERSHDPSPEALIDAGAEIVLPATAVDDLDAHFWAAVTAIPR